MVSDGSAEYMFSKKEETGRQIIDENALNDKNDVLTSNKAF